MFSISTHYLIKIAKERGLKLEVINEDFNLFYLANNEKKILFKNIDGGINTSLSAKISGNKYLTYELLDYYKIPYPKSIKLSKSDYNEINLEKFFEEQKLEFPLVVKPTDTDHGDGISVEIKTLDELKFAINYAFGFSDDIIIQKFIKGYDHRILVVGDKVIAGIKRIPAFVLGNGNDSIEKLINIENKTNPYRGSIKKMGHTSIYEKALVYIEIDDIVIKYLKNQYNYNIKSVPKKDEIVYLRGNSNISTGGTYMDITDFISEDIKNISIKVADIFGLKVAGIDVMIEDISNTLEGNGGIIEINCTPGTDMHEESLGGFRNVSGAILDLYGLK